MSRFRLAAHGIARVLPDLLPILLREPRLEKGDRLALERLQVKPLARRVVPNFDVEVGQRVECGHCLLRVAPEAIEVVEHHRLESPGRRIAHHPLKFGAVREQRPAYLAIGVDVRLIERPALTRNEGTSTFHLSADALRLVGHSCLVGRFPCVYRGDHSFTSFRVRIPKPQPCAEFLV